jgi:membrane protease YdiL (CAAX protease family)
MMVAVMREEHPPWTPRGFLLLVCALYGLLAAGALVWLRLSERTVAVATGLRSLTAGLLLGALVVLLTRLALDHSSWVSSLAREFRKLLPELRWSQILVVAVASGTAEELFFRGAMQPALGLLPTTLIFGLLHTGPARVFLPWTAFALMMGLALGLLYLLTADLAGPVAAHVLINALNLGALQSRSPGVPEQR